MTKVCGVLFLEINDKGKNVNAFEKVSVWILTKTIRLNFLKPLYIYCRFIVVFNLLVGLLKVRNKKIVGDN